MTVINIGSASAFKTILKASTVVVTDFYADWCGPCKTIAPVYEKLASTHTKARAITFTKVNVDNQQEISRKYGVTSMPTFMIFKNGTIINTIKGADPRALAAAVETAANGAVPSHMATPGRTLGSALASPPPRTTSGPDRVHQASSLSPTGIFNAILTFFGLYFISLFALDPRKAAEVSMFNIHSDDAPLKPFGSRSAGSAGRKVEDRPKIGRQGDRKFATVDDLGKES